MPGEEIYPDNYQEGKRASEDTPTGVAEEFGEKVLEHSGVGKPAAEASVDERYSKRLEKILSWTGENPELLREAAIHLRRKAERYRSDIGDPEFEQPNALQRAEFNEGLAEVVEARAIIAESSDGEAGVEEDDGHDDDSGRLIHENEAGTSRVEGDSSEKTDEEQQPEEPEAKSTKQLQEEYHQAQGELSWLRVQKERLVILINDITEQEELILSHITDDQARYNISESYKYIKEHAQGEAYRVLNDKIDDTEKNAERLLKELQKADVQRFLRLHPR
jgi:hypothetical protein